MANDLASWLSGLGLGHLVQTFEEQEVDLAAACELTEADLRELGLPMGPRKKLLRAIEDLRASTQGAPMPADLEMESGQPQPDAEGESRQVTILFSDVAGFTKLSNQIDAEEVHDLLQVYFECADEIVRRHGGIVDKHIGDSVMAIFGVPVALGNEAERALDAAIAIQAVMPEVSAKAGREVQVHIGLASGRVVANRFGSKKEYTVIGESVNLAARLTDKAGAGQTLVSEPVRSALPLGLDFGDKIDWELKGFDDPVSGYLITADFDRGNASQQISPLVGRAREVGQFRLALDDCETRGRGQFVFLRGEPGIGKTRLAHEFSAISARSGFDLHRVLVLDFGARHGDDAPRSILRSLIGLTPDTSEEDQRDLVAGILGSGFVSEDTAPHLYSMLGLRQPDELRALYDAMSPGMRAAGQIDLICQSIVSAAAERGLFLLVEDIHWADNTTIATLAAMIRAIDDSHAIIVATSRFEGDPLNKLHLEGLGSTELTTLDLRSLRPEEAEQLAAGYLDPSQDLVRFCIERSEGNPLYLEQLLRNGATSGFDAVPDTVQSLVQASLDKLARWDREALEVAAVMGQRFDLSRLRNVLGRPDYDPKELIVNRLVHSDRDQFLFAHALVRDGVYASILASQRRRMHARVAETLGAEDIALRARHLERAEHPDAAEAYLAAATAEAEALDENAALALCEAGLSLASSPEIRLKLLFLKGDAQRNLGQTEASIETFRQTVEEADRSRDRGLALVGVAEGQRIASRFEDALATLDAAEKVSDAVPVQTRARIFQLRGSVCFPIGDVQGCFEAHERALELAHESGAPDCIASSLSGLGDALYLQGRMKDARARFTECIEICREHDLGRIETANLQMVGWSRIYMLEFREAFQDGIDAAEMANRVGQRRAEIGGYQLAALSAFKLGENEQARSMARAGLAIANEIGATIFAINGHTLLAQIDALEGDMAGAREKIAISLEKLDSIGRKFNGPYVLSVAAAVDPDPEKSRAYVAEMEDILDTGCVSHNYAWGSEEAIGWALANADWEAVERHARRLEAFTARQPLDWTELIIERARVLSAIGQGRGDSAVLDRARCLSDRAARHGLVREAASLAAALAARR